MPSSQPRRSNGQFASTNRTPPTPPPALPNLAQPNAGQSWEFKYHLTFANFHAKTIRETKHLFRSRPSQLDEEARKLAFQRWIVNASETYNMEQPRILWDEEADFAGGGFYRPSDHSITLSPSRPSITTLLHEFRHALQTHNCGPSKVDSDLEVDARAWSLSLYYRCRPSLFRRLVLEGRILHINPQVFR